MGQGATKVPALGPPETTDPPNSIRAKALHALWWAVQPYVNDTKTALGSGKWVQVPHQGSGRSNGTSHEDEAVHAALVHYSGSTRTLVLSFAGSKAVIEAMKLGAPASSEVRPSSLGVPEKPELAPLDFLKAAAPKAMVNAALLEGEAKDVMGRTMAAIDEVLPPGETPLSVLCTGYGSGGALATLASVRLALRFPQADTTCVAFGSPFVGNKEFAEAFNLLVGLSFRVEHAGDTITSQPNCAPWTFPATWDIKCGLADSADPLNNHKLSSYFKAVLGLGACSSLPRNAPGVYLLLSPSDINREKGSNSPWPIDDFFVPAKGDSKGLKSPYDALVELGDGVKCTISDLFDSESQVWKSVRAKLEKRGPIGYLGSLLAPLVGAERPKVERASNARERFMGEAGQATEADTAAKPDAGLEGRVKDAVKGEQPSDKTESIEYLEYKEMGEDLAGKGRAFDLLAAHRLSLPLLLAQAAYRTSATSAQAHPPFYPASDAKGDFLNDPFGGAIQDIKDEVLGYRLIDDCAFECEGKPLDVQKRMPSGNKTDTQAYVIWLKDGTAVFAFRGTSNKGDWMSNIDFTRSGLGSWEEGQAQPTAEASGQEVPGSQHKPGMRGGVHRGFMRGFCAVAYRRDEKAGVSARHLAGVLQELMRERPVAGLQPEQGPARVIVVGHSLGGALATLGAAWAAEQYPLAPVSLYTFGQPRVGDSDFISHLNTVVGYSARVVHRLDVVPLVPLNKQGFLHYYPAAYLGCSYRERLTAILSFIPHQSQLHLGFQPDNRWLGLVSSVVRGVGDHFMASYQDCYKVAMKSLGATQIKKEQPKE